MRAIMVMYDSLNRHMLAPYGCDWTQTPQFTRLAEHAVTFDNCWVGSMPCMPARRELHTGVLPGYSESMARYREKYCERMGTELTA